MKLIFNHFLLLALLILIALCSSACKTRQVDIQKRHTVDSSNVTRVIKTDSSHTDTGKFFQHFKDSVTTKDAYEATILTDTGVVVLNNGVFTGRAKSIIIKRTVNRDSTIIKNLFLANAINDTFHVVDSSRYNKNIVTDDNHKHVDTKPDYSWIIWVVAGLIILIGAYLLYRHFIL